MIDLIETLAHYLVAVVFLVIVGVVLSRTGVHLVTNRHHFAVQVTSGINDVLFVVIVLELLRTVVAHLETEDFQLRSFLIIGIIVDSLFFGRLERTIRRRWGLIDGAV